MFLSWLLYALIRKFAQQGYELENNSIFQHGKEKNVSEIPFYGNSNHCHGSCFSTTQKKQVEPLSNVLVAVGGLLVFIGISKKKKGKKTINDNYRLNFGSSHNQPKHKRSTT